MAINIEKNSCCGCMACANICPAGAISAVKDEDGFLYPRVDAGKCVECGLCEKACGFGGENHAYSAPAKAWSLIHRDRDVLMNSTSGGAFTALSDAVLAKGGVVFGACMNETFDVRHIEAADPATRDSMRGSLYVQSDTGDTYRRVKAYLEQGKPVMFVGTPCQGGGLLSFLQKPYENLVVVEFLCHGVPGNDFFKQHIAFLEKKYSAKAKWYTFRSKRYAWWTHGIEEIEFEDGTRKATQAVQAYSHFFQSGISLRPSCLHCTYRRIERAADITIADFWGIEKLTGKRSSTGVSMLLGNTEKGVALIEALDAKAAEIAEVPFEKVKYRIQTKPAKPSKDPEAFRRLLHERGYEAVVDKYTDTSLKAAVRFALRKLSAKQF